MHIHANRFTKGFNRWGIFAGREFGGWYANIHTPWLIVQAYSTDELFSASYWGRNGYHHFPREN